MMIMAFLLLCVAGIADELNDKKEKYKVNCNKIQFHNDKRLHEINIKQSLA